MKSVGKRQPRLINELCFLHARPKDFRASAEISKIGRDFAKGERVAAGIAVRIAKDEDSVLHLARECD